VKPRLTSNRARTCGGVDEAAASSRSIKASGFAQGAHESTSAANAFVRTAYLRIPHHQEAGTGDGARIWSTSTDAVSMDGGSPSRARRATASRLDHVFVVYGFARNEYPLRVVRSVRG
jgi:hypothetical protein